MRKPNFVVDVENFRLVQDEVGIGEIKELSNDDAGLLAPHIDGHPDTLYIAASGVNLSYEYGVFDAEQDQVAVEWVRLENSPTQGEPECNTYRFLFGLTSDSHCIGLDVTKKPTTGQVADHWTTFENAISRHFPDF